MTNPVHSHTTEDHGATLLHTQTADLAPLRFDCRLPRLLIHGVQTYVEVRVQRVERVPEDEIKEVNITLITAAAKDGSAQRSITFDEGSSSVVRLFFEPSRVGRFLADLQITVTSARGNMRADGEWSPELQIEPYPDSVKSLSINMSGGVFAPFAEQMQFMKDADINTVVSREFPEAPWEALKLKWSWASPSAHAKPDLRAAFALLPAFRLVMLTVWAALIASGCWLAANALLPRNEASLQAKSAGRSASSEAAVLPEAKSLEDAQIGQTYTVRLPGGTEMKLCYCPPTSYRTEPFLMGSPESEDWHDKTEQQIEVRLTHGFWMAQTECTQAQWSAITDSLHDVQIADVTRKKQVSEVSWTSFTKSYDQKTDGKFAPGSKRETILKAIDQAFQTLRPRDPVWVHCQRYLDLSSLSYSEIGFSEIQNKIRKAIDEVTRNESTLDFKKKGSERKLATNSEGGWTAKSEDILWTEFKNEYDREIEKFRSDDIYKDWATREAFKELEFKLAPEDHNPSYPIANLSWNEVHDTFLRKLKERVPLPNGWTWSLPTEAEWEWACRAGSSGLWGNRENGKMGSLGEMGWYLTSQTHEVNTKKPNAWGLHDMHGSLWEWCNDSWNGETVLPGGQNPISQFGTEKVVRGGGFLSVASDCRAAKRGNRPIIAASSDSSSSSSSDSPKTTTYPTFNDVGFRLVVVPSNEAAVREKTGNKTN